MTTEVSAADATEAFHRILRGNFQRAVDAYAALEPKLRKAADGLAAAVKRCDVAVMSFEYKRVEAFNRGVGALLNRIAAALEDLDAIAGEPEFAAVQTRAAHHVHALGAMKKTLTRQLQLVNRLQAKAATAIEAANRRAGEFDVDWERLQDKVEETLRTFEGLNARMDRVRGAVANAHPDRRRELDEAVKQAATLVGTAPAAQAERLRRELARIGDAVVIESTSASFAVQFRKERAKAEKQLERVDQVLSVLRATQREALAIQAKLR